jgi:hypothetical protein
MKRFFTAHPGWLCGLVAVIAVVTATPAAAQNDPNPGALTFTGSFDYASLYYFRGIRQEADPGVTFFAAGDLGIALFSGDGAIKSGSANIGVWHSLNTGSSGSDGPRDALHYEEDFYATFGLGFGGGWGLGTTYTIYSSPNLMFATIKELGFKVTKAGRFNPYGILAFELSDAGVDGEGDGSTYLELGAGPTFPLGSATLTVPVKLGMSVNKYYEVDGDDQKFGFFDVGGLVTLPLGKVDSKYGAWNAHAGADWLYFGDESFTGLLNEDEDGELHSSGFVFILGIGVSY